MRVLLAACALATTITGVRVTGGQRPAGGPPPPTQGTTLPAAVEEVLVDVVVADRDGDPIGGLTREDFVVAEDGAPQAILSFEAVEVAP